MSQSTIDGVIKQFPEPMTIGLQKLAHNRQETILRIAELEKERKALNRQLDELGPKKTAKSKELTWQLVRADRALKEARERRDRQADRIMGVLLDPTKDFLFDQLDEPAHEPPEDLLFTPGAEPNDGDGDGSSEETEDDEDKPEDPDQHQLAELSGEEAKVAALLPSRFADQNGEEFEIKTMGGMFELCRDRVGGEHFFRVVTSKQYGTRVQVRAKKAARAKIMLSLEVLAPESAS